MKKIYLLLLPVLFLWGSCSMDDVLESNGELNLTVIETNNPIKAEPGETVVFQFVASTSKGELKPDRDYLGRWNPAYRGRRYFCYGG